ncbi:MAG: hypothetical protein HOP29_00765 [Phycisphaerales bacterium]|nr:hypothetical protein [Phycisphaerales bacterium]
MATRGIRGRWMRLVGTVAVGGCVLQLGSCDPNVRTTLLSGLATTTEALTDTLIQTFFTSLAQDAAGGSGAGQTTT